MFLGALSFRHTFCIRNGAGSQETSAAALTVLRVSAVCYKAGRDQVVTSVRERCSSG